MKVTLVNPHYEEPEVLKKLGLPSIPLGYAIVAAMIEKAGYEVEVIDAFGEKLNTAQTIERLKASKPDITGITCVTCNVDIAKEIATAARNFSMVVMGGTQPSLDPASVVDYCDYVVVGEGEETFPELLAASDKKQVKGILFKKNGEIIQTPPRPVKENLDEFPFPARHLFPMDCYKQFGVMLLGTMLTSRGCPRGCVYCTISQLFPRWRARSPKNTVDEMELLVKEYGCKGISIVDEDFLISKERAERIAEEIMRRKLKVWWGMQTRASNLSQPDLALLKKMRKAGCEFALFGVESARVETMKKLNRDLPHQVIFNAFNLCKKAGMRTAASSIICFPGEVEEDALYTIDFIKKLDPSYVFFGVPTPFPGTKFHKACVEQNLIKEKNLLKYTIMSPILATEKISLEKAGELLNKAYRSFYFRPTYLLRRMFYEIRKLDWDTLKGFMVWSIQSFFKSLKW